MLKTEFAPLAAAQPSALLLVSLMVAASAADAILPSALPADERSSMNSLRGRNDNLSGALATKTYFVQVESDETPDDPNDADLFAMELITADLVDARAALARCDANDDRRLDQEEMKRLGWKLDPRAFDLDKNRHLTQLEVAVHFAFRRQQAKIDRADVVVMNRVLARYDQNGDRTLSPGEMRDARWPPDPKFFDLDGNGRLNQFELATGISKNRRRRQANGITGFDTKRAIEFVARYDANGDKAVDFEEFDASDSLFNPKDYDADNSGGLVKDEIALAFAKRRDAYDIKLIDQQNTLVRLNRYDRNRDRHLDEQEIMVAKWPEKPSQYDLDKDQRLSRFELEAAMAKERKARGVSADDVEIATRLIARYDKNQNKQIDLTEVDDSPPAGVEKKHHVSTDAFVDFDDNIDQKLDRNETAAFVASRRTK